MLFFSPSVFFVKEVSVLKRGRGGPLVCANHNMEEGVLQKEWSSVCEVAGRDAAQLDVHPPAACPINLQMQSIRQTADWLAPDSRKSYSHPKYGVSETGPLVSFWRSLASTWGRQIVFKKKMVTKHERVTAQQGRSQGFTRTGVKNQNTESKPTVQPQLY